MSFLAPTQTQSQTPVGIANPNQAASTPLILGGVTFRSEECPSELAIGAGEQKLAVIELIGGGRTVYSMGAQFKPVSWTGGFFEGNVQGRVQALRALMVSGQEISITYLYEQYYGKIKEFVPTYKNQFWAHYAITVEITRDANGAFSSSAPPSLDSQVAALLASSNDELASLSVLDPSGSAALTAPLSNLNLAITTAGPLAQTSGTLSTSLIATAGTALSAAQTYLATVAQTNIAQFASATSLVATLNLIQTNISLGQTTNSQRVQGGSTYLMAAQYYGDVTQAFALMKFNNQFTPWIPQAVATVVTLPPFPQP